MLDGSEEDVVSSDSACDSNDADVRAAAGRALAYTHLHIPEKDAMEAERSTRTVENT